MNSVQQQIKRNNIKQMGLKGTPGENTLDKIKVLFIYKLQ